MHKIKVLAMYLPQFHRVVENDLWWGKGFTDWVAVKKAKALFKDHIQPREPLDNNYYDLMDKSVMQWQTDLARKYLVDGFCFYHYWFKDGKRILEKPAENLLKWKDIKISFCFSWANESWGRSWSNIDIPNVWSSKFEPDSHANENQKGILLEQKYGDKEQWEKHFEYLLQFFEDDRYIKIDNKPVFVIYRPLLIPCLERMVSYWNELAIKSGFSGIYIIGTNVIGKNSVFDARLLQMPGCIDISALPRVECYGGNVRGVSYDKLWESLFDQEISSDGRDLLCGIVDYDNTPRMGTAGLVIMKNSVEKFQHYYEKLLECSLMNNNKLVFLNAWNEWGESNYLEPDKKNGYSYLEAIYRVMTKYKKIDTCTRSDVGNTVLKNNYIRDLEKRTNRFQKGYNLLHRWMLIKEEGKLVSEYLARMGYLSVAIYGMGINGKHLKTELKNTNINVLYGIDLKGDSYHDDIPIYGIQDVYPKADIIIVSIIDEFTMIANLLNTRVDCPIISLEEIIFEI